jgi:hypothetical protein
MRDEMRHGIDKVGLWRGGGGEREALIRYWGVGSCDSWRNEDRL